MNLIHKLLITTKLHQMFAGLMFCSGHVTLFCDHLVLMAHVFVPGSGGSQSSDPGSQRTEGEFADATSQVMQSHDVT